MKIGKESMYYDPEVPYDAIAIANYFIDCARSDGCEDLNPMKVQKLVYFAHGWYAGIVGEPLIQEPVEAWSYGPVIASIYREFKHYGNRKIIEKAVVFGKNLSSDAKIKKFLDDIWNTYNKRTAIELANMTHEPESPWSYTIKEYEKYKNGAPNNSPVVFKLIENYFKLKLEILREKRFK